MFLTVNTIYFKKNGDKYIKARMKTLMKTNLNTMANMDILTYCKNY